MITAAENARVVLALLHKRSLRLVYCVEGGWPTQLSDEEQALADALDEAGLCKPLQPPFASELIVASSVLSDDMLIARFCKELKRRSVILSKDDSVSEVMAAILDEIREAIHEVWQP